MPVQITCNQQIIGPVHEKTNNVGSTRRDTNQAVQSQKMASGLKFRI